MDLAIVAPGLIAPIPLYLALKIAGPLSLLVAAVALAGGWAVWAYVAEWALVRRHRPSPFDPEFLP